MKRKRDTRGEIPIPWLPVDSRVILPLFSFGSIRGIAKAFLIVEMTLAIGVVLGTLTVVLLGLLI